MWKIASCIAILLIVVCPYARARQLNTDDLINMPIEELLQVEVISVSRLGQQANESPAAISVLNANDIRTFGWRTLADALNGMRGLFTTSDRNYTYLGVRGFIHTNDYNSRVLFMIDGQRMNENLYDGGYIAQEFMLDMDLIERIEFIPGSGGAIYGANAFTGLINIVTKSGQKINGTQLTGEAGRFDSYKGRVSYGKKFQNGTDLMLSASHFDREGVENLYFKEYDTPDTNHGIAHNSDAERADRLLGRVAFGDFTLMGGYVDRFKQIPTASFAALFNDPAYYSRDSQFFSNLKYEKTLSNKTTVRLKGSYQGYDYNSEQPYDNNGRVMNHDFASGRWWSGEAQLTNTSFEHHRLMLGVEYQYDQRQHLLNADIDPYQLYNDVSGSGSRAQVYVQDDIHIVEELILSAGLRLDYHHYLKHLQLNPRLGLIWNPLESTSLKLLYSSTFRAPNLYEQGYGIGVVNVTNHEERVKSYESIVEWHSESGLKLTADGFYNDMTNILEQDADSGAFVNKDHYQVLGFDFEAEQRWDTGRLLKASYTYSRLNDETDGGIWAFASPQNLFKLHYAEPLFNDFGTLGVESIYIGERKALQGGLANDYNLVNLNLSSDQLLKGLMASVGVYNLFDTHYQAVGGSGEADLQQNILFMNGREYRLKLQFTF